MLYATLYYLGIAATVIAFGAFVVSMNQRGRFETQWRAENPLPEGVLQRLRAPASGIFMPAATMSETCRTLRRDTVRTAAVFAVACGVGIISFAAMHAL